MLLLLLLKSSSARCRRRGRAASHHNSGPVGCPTPGPLRWPAALGKVSDFGTLMGVPCETAASLRAIYLAALAAEDEVIEAMATVPASDNGITAAEPRKKRKDRPAENPPA